MGNGNTASTRNKVKLIQQAESFHYPFNYMSGNYNVVGQDGKKK